MKSALAAAVTSKLLVGAAVAAAASGGIALVAYHGVQNGHSTDPTTLPTTSASASATPSPNLNGLCTAYQAGATDNSGKASDSPAFQALASAAGGADQVDTYCATLLANDPSAPVHPTGPPTALPTQASDHATGAPTALPTQASEHASDEPSSMPTEASDHAPGDSSNRP